MERNVITDATKQKQRVHNAAEAHLLYCSDLLDVIFFMTENEHTHQEINDKITNEIKKQIENLLKLKVQKIYG